MPSVAIKYSMGLTTLKTQSVQFRVNGIGKEIVLPAGKVISQQLVDLVLKVAPPDFEVVVAAAVNLQEIVDMNRKRVESAHQGPGAQASIVTEYDTGVMIFEQGDRSDEIYILNQGSVAVLVNGTQVATISEKGSYFGELSILTGVVRSATIRTLEPCRFTIIPGAALESAVQQNPAIGYKLAVLLAGRLKQTNTKAVSATGKAERYAGRIKTLAGAVNVFLGQAANPLSVEVGKRLKTTGLIGNDGKINIEETLK